MDSSLFASLLILSPTAEVLLIGNCILAINAIFILFLLVRVLENVNQELFDPSSSCLHQHGTSVHRNPPLAISGYNLSDRKAKGHLRKKRMLSFRPADISRKPHDIRKYVACLQSWVFQCYSMNHFLANWALNNNFKKTGWVRSLKTGYHRELKHFRSFQPCRLTS